MYVIEDLIRKYNSGECSPQEKIWLEQWYHTFEWNNKSDALTDSNIEKLKNEVWEELKKNTLPTGTLKIVQSAPRALTFTRWQYAAAMFIAAIALGAFYLFQPAKENTGIARTIRYPQIQQQTFKEVKAGTSKAELILGDGRVVSLDSAQTMQLKEKNGTTITKQPGKLVYNNGISVQPEILFNTLSTPRGGEYQVVLPDGSKVWLNAASSLKFPVRFSGSERVVFLRGEAYFEVAKNKQMPFKVKLDNDMAVEVTGTRFNIMSYDDESDVTTTLEEGSVTVTSQVKTVNLSPSRQAVMNKSNRSLAVINADVEKAVAWKNGMIEFDGNDLPYIMRQLSRWYDVDVRFNGSIPKGTYNGAIRRQAPLLKVMEILKLAGVQFKQEDKKLIVTGG